MKKLLLFFLLLVVIIICPVQARAEQINDFQVKININNDGTINVVEKIVYDFDGLYRHGIYRIIPYTKINNQNKRFKMDFKIGSVTDEEENRYPFTISDADYKLTIKIGDPNKTITGIHTYLINYQVAGALTYFSDHDELYWNATGNDWTVDIQQSQAAITLPENTPAENIKLTCYTGFSGSREKNCSASYNDGAADFKTSQLLSAGQGLTVILGFPKNIVAILEPKEIIPFTNTFLGKIVIFFLILLGIFWYIIYPLWLPIRWWFRGRDPKVKLKAVRAWYDPPKTRDGRSLTPAETGILVDESVDNRDIFATIVDLARRGYFKIVEKKKNDFSFIKRKDYLDDQSLQLFEQELLMEIFKDKDDIKIKELKLYYPIEKIKQMIYKGMIKEGFFPADPHQIRIFYGVITTLALFTLNFPLVVSSLIFGRIMAKKTVYGKEQANVAKSLFNFLTSQKRQLEFQAKTNLPDGRQVFFEKLLPYAVAFGVERVWAKRFTNMNLRQPDWYQTYDGRAFSILYFTNSLNLSLSSFKSAVTPTTSTSGFSSGFSGGSSGGGGGGGGGGSW